MRIIQGKVTFLSTEIGLYNNYFVGSSYLAVAELNYSRETLLRF